LIEGKGQEHGWEVLALSLQPDHLPVCGRVWPSHSAAAVAKACKGLTSFHWRREFAHVLKRPCLWTRSSFASTAGNVSPDPLQRSSAAQTGR
jgi:putative transposase